jgi:hypothetical protein
MIGSRRPAMTAMVVAAIAPWVDKRDQHRQLPHAVRGVTRRDQAGRPGVLGTGREVTAFWSSPAPVPHREVQ